MQVLGRYDRDYYTELMVQFLDGDKEVRLHRLNSPPLLHVFNHKTPPIHLLKSPPFQTKCNGRAEAEWDEGRAQVLDEGAGQLGRVELGGVWSLVGNPPTVQRLARQVSRLPSLTFD